jgi:poly(A) polymerase
MDCLSAHGDLRLYEYAKQHFETATPETIRPPLLVTGRDLIAAGYRPGTQFKEMLEAAEDAQLESIVSSRTEAMKLLRERFGAPPQAFSTLTSA